MDTEKMRARLEEEKARLERIREGLVAETNQDFAGGEDVSELSSIDQHPADSGTEEFEREKDLSILERVEIDLQDVGRALEKLDSGDYGKCEVCGKPIGDERLEARPMAAMCLEHQRESEGRAAAPPAV